MPPPELLVQYVPHAALVIFYVAGIRRYVPKIDGWMVLVLAVLLSVGVVVGTLPEEAGWRTVLFATIGVSGAAIGGNEWIGKMADRASSTTLPNVTELPASVKAPILPSVTEVPAGATVVLPAVTKAPSPAAGTTTTTTTVETTDTTAVSDATPEPVAADPPPKRSHHKIEKGSSR